MPESDLVWKYPPETFTYLRESKMTTCRWKGNIRGYRTVPIWGIWVRTLEELKSHAGELKEWRLMVGYANWSKEPFDLTGVYWRRFWWLTNHDRDIMPDEGPFKDTWPPEAVDARLIKVGGYGFPGTEKTGGE